MQLSIIKDLLRELIEKVSILSVDIKRLEERMDYFAKQMYSFNQKNKK